jgi:hypothetical protein
MEFISTRRIETMARVNNDIQQDEVRAYEKFCIEHNILLGGGSDDVASIANANLVRDYFTKTWHETISAETLEKALPALRPHLKFKSAARAEFEKIASADPDRASQLDVWLQAHGGKPGQLVYSLYTDDTYENLFLLLTTLGGYEISTPRIQDAIDRIQNRPGRKLHYVPTPRRTEPVSRAAKEDDGKPFVTDGLTLQRDGSLGKSPADYAREARARSDQNVEAANQQRTSAHSVAAREAQRKAEGLRGNTHSEDEQIGRVFILVEGTSEINWPATLQSRLALQQSINKHRETVRFIR